MKQRSFIQLAIAVVFAVGCSAEPAAPATATRESPAPKRIVSLSPAITETLFEIGAGDDVVGVSQFSEHPQNAASLPVVGTALAPNYEAIARLRPSVIFSESAAQEKRTELAALAPTRSLPWLTAAEITSSIRELGMLTGRHAEAEALAQKMSESLERSVAPGAPRVLFVLASGDPGDIFFLRRNSIHGAALEAAGARNAVERDVAGLPRLSLEAAFELDPDAVIILAADSSSAGAAASHWRALPLRAARTGNISTIAMDGALIGGPRIIQLRDRLAAAIEKIGVNR